MEKETGTKKPTETPAAESGSRIKTRQGSGYLKQLYSTARTTAGTTHTNLKSTTFMVNFIPTEKIDASELQVRVHFEDSEIAVLAHSIKEHGVLQPILVVQDGDRYKVIAGERRLRATKLAGIDRIPARVMQTTDKATHEIALRENLDRVDLHPIEEGEGYLSLLEAQQYTSHDSISKAFGKPKSRITECIGFTKLPHETKWELMRRGMKGRNLLRTLLTTSPEQHLEMIVEANAKEEALANQELPTIQTGATVAAATDSQMPPEKKREPRPFNYRCDKKGVSVPGFKWKVGEGNDTLQQYAESLRMLVKAVETRLAEASSKK